MSRTRWVISVLALVALALPLPALAQPRAQDGVKVAVSATATCSQVEFSTSVEGGAAPFGLSWQFGDGEIWTEAGVSEFPHSTVHAYPASGDYTWVLDVSDGADPVLTGSATGTVSLGPKVTLTSDPFPPALDLVNGETTATFTAQVEGGTEPMTFAWDLTGAASSTSDPSSNVASAVYNTTGHYTAIVTVTDSCGLMGSDSLPVVVGNPEEACHPMAQRIADAVNTLFPSQSGQLYACEDIFAAFDGSLTGGQVGFGHMWHAYRLALTMPDLTWQEILDWHLDNTGWGLLLQLRRGAEQLDSVSLADLVGRVMSGENSISDTRAALRVAVQFDADFEGALNLLEQGVTRGELGQLYRTAADLQVDPEVLAGYTEAGVGVAELRHAARLAVETGQDWAALVEAHASGMSWGALRKGDLAAVSSPGPQAPQDQTPKGRDPSKEKGPPQGPQNGPRENQADGEAQQQSRTQTQIDAHIADLLAMKYGVTAEQVLAIYQGTCNFDWTCARTELRRVQGIIPERGPEKQHHSK